MDTENMSYEDILEYITDASKISNTNLQNHVISVISRILDTKFRLNLNLDCILKYKLKSVLIDVIIDQHAYGFVPIYNEYIGDILFVNTDKDLHSVDKQSEKAQIPPISAEKLIALEKEAVEKIKTNQLFKVNPSYKLKYKDNRLFSIGELVLAKDCNDKYWIARIVSYHEDKTTCNEVHMPIRWYLVHYEGFSDYHNEWVQHGPRIQKFYNKYYFKHVKSGSLADDDIQATRLLNKLGSSVDQPGSVASSQDNNSFGRSLQKENIEGKYY